MSSGGNVRTIRETPTHGDRLNFGKEKGVRGGEMEGGKNSATRF